MKKTDMSDIVRWDKPRAVGDTWRGGLAAPAGYPPLSRTKDAVPSTPLKPAPNDIQVGGDHYKTQGIQTWDYITANKLDYFQGNIVKYVSRWKDKGGVEDLKKARHYLDKYIEVSDK